MKINIEDKCGEIVNSLADIANICGTGKEEGELMAQLLMAKHRTLQQCSIRIILEIIQAYASNPGVDLRNQDAVDICKELAEVLRDKRLAYV
jgi:hydroxypyruvate isomerase